MSILIFSVEKMLALNKWVYSHSTLYLMLFLTLRVFLYICFSGSSICPKSLILSRPCTAGGTTRPVEQNVHNEAPQGINGSVPVKQYPRSASNPKPQGKELQIFLLGKLFFISDFKRNRVP